MVTFEESRERRKSRTSSPRRDSGARRDSRGSFGDRPKRFSPRNSSRERSGGRDGPRRTEFTKVVCSSCGTNCEVPFKPTSNKPIFCDDCFSKKGNSKISENDLDIINEKLNKIMKALKIQ